MRARAPDEERKGRLTPEDAGKDGSENLDRAAIRASSSAPRMSSREVADGAEGALRGEESGGGAGGSEDGGG